MTISNPLERRIADALDSRGIKWLHEDEKGNDAELDFYLPDYGVYIEIKQAFTPRSERQLERAKNVVLVQGIEAVDLLTDLISTKTKEHHDLRSERSIPRGDKIH